MRVNGEVHWTTPKRALKYLERGQARYIDEGTIEMIPDNPRHLATVQSIDSAAPRGRERTSPNLPAAVPEPVICDSNLGQTFGHYPMFADRAFRRREAA